jgi:hypothetical protein
LVVGKMVADYTLLRVVARNLARLSFERFFNCRTCANHLFACHRTLGSAGGEL